jgi:predicted dehydrogenase
LVSNPEVDLVLILTTSQQHEAGVRAAIAAGKNVYSEWPLTPTSARSAELAKLAEEAGVKTQIGLQRQFAPAFRYVHDLIKQGYVGKLRSVRLHCSVSFFGEVRSNALRWSLPVENFMSVVAIFGGHFLPVLFSMVGRPATFSSLVVNQFPLVTIKETGEKVSTTSPDELMMQGTLAGGGLFSVHLEGGKLNGSGVQIDITGDAGDLKITNTSAFGDVSENYIVAGAKGEGKPLSELPIPDSYVWFPAPGIQTGAAELGDLYVALADDFKNGTQIVPDFREAVWLQKLLEQASTTALGSQQVAH